MQLRLRLPTRQSLAPCLAAACLALAAAAARSEVPVASGHAQYEGGSMVNPGSEGQSIPYVVTGPGKLVVDYEVSPYRRREFYSSVENCLSYSGPEYWGHVSSEAWYGSQRATDFATPPAADGSVTSYRSRTVWDIPAQRFEGSFLISRPVKCGLADCSGFSATVNFNAYFYPAGETPPPASDTPPAGPEAAGGGAESAGGLGGAAAPGGGVVPPGSDPATGGALSNLALGRPSQQSSIYTGTGVDQGPQHGNDGIGVGRDPHDLVLTNTEPNPWWYVDLGTLSDIDHLRIVNRRNPEVLANPSLMVFISTDRSTWQPVYRHDGSRWDELTLPVAAQGRFVLLQLAEPGGLQFYEVEVWGRP